MRRTRSIDADFWLMFDRLKKFPTPHGRSPTEVMITGLTFPTDWAHGMGGVGQGVI
jgi:hypothetical protein